MKNFDDVNGQIVGGDFGQCWVTYKCRKQGPTKYPMHEAEAYAFCDGIVQSIKDDCGAVFKDTSMSEQGVAMTANVRGLCVRAGF